MTVKELCAIVCFWCFVWTLKAPKTYFLNLLLTTSDGVHIKEQYSAKYNYFSQL